HASIVSKGTHPQRVGDQSVVEGPLLEGDWQQTPEPAIEMETVDPPSGEPAAEAYVPEPPVVDWAFNLGQTADALITDQPTGAPSREVEGPVIELPPATPHVAEGTSGPKNPFK